MAKLLAKHLKMTITNNTMNKEPKEVDWSKQKPGTIGVTRGRAKRVEFIAARDNEAVFYSSSQGFIQRKINGAFRDGLECVDDILLPWESCIAEGHNPDGLTNGQVGEGWRLLNLGETAGANAQHWRNEWVSNGAPTAREIITSHVSHRVPITKAKKRIPCGPEHFPPGTVVHAGDPLHHSHVCLYAGDELVAWGQHYSMKMLSEMTHWRRSTDFGKTWLPCYVEIESNE